MFRARMRRIHEARPTTRRRAARRRRSAARFTLVAVAFLLFVAGLTPAWAEAGGVDDWVHVWEVVQYVRVQQTLPEPPTGPVVYNLGDSVARESTVSDAAWTRQLQARAQAVGRRDDVVAYTVAGHNQTFAMDKTIVEALPSAPAGAPRPIVLIGVGISRFSGPPAPKGPASVEAPPPGELPQLSPWSQHRYDGRRVLPRKRKRELVPRWMDRRWTGFKKHRRGNVIAIAQVVRVCQARGLRPVLYDLPLDLTVAARGLRKPRAAVHADCSRLAKRFHITYLSLQPALSLPSRGFWDLHHLVRRGSTRWQARLSGKLVGLLPSQ